MDIRIIVGDNIRGFRHKLDWSQEKLSVRAALHINYISSVERGERNLGIINVVKIAKALKIEPHVLLIKDSYKKTPHM
jgi:transcriptional regulator with XRE-family HTH domain